MIEVEKHVFRFSHGLQGIKNRGGGGGNEVDRVGEIFLSHIMAT